MICTFGDLTDVTWWRELGLPTRSIVGRDGRLGPALFGTHGWESKDPGRANANYAEIEGMPVKRAQTRIVELLRESGDLLGEPRAITHRSSTTNAANGRSRSSPPRSGTCGP